MKGEEKKKGKITRGMKPRSCKDENSKRSRGPASLKRRKRKKKRRLVRK